MSQVIDTKVVEMVFDNSKFEKNIQTSLNSLKLLNKNIDDAGQGRNSLDELARAGDNVGLSFDNMNIKSRISLNLMDLLAGVGTKAFNKISDAVAGFAMNMASSLSGMKAMRDGFNEYELKMGSVQTILAGAKIIDPNTGKELTDEAERLAVVNQRLEDLNKYSDRTIYSFKDMTSNIGKFTNAGVSLDDAVDAIQGVANVAAISGANANEASRAMYNFAQALSSGYVKLIDWKSIENANMATVGFKEELLKTALAVGTVRKEGDKYVTTTTDANGKVSEAFDATMMFNDSLSHQWMTTEVLTKTLKKYTDESTELGKKAFAAATEVKTFSQMMDTLKESLGSGWAQSFEIIFGNFTEAKELWTGLNNAIDGILSPIGKVRNAILQTWKDDGGRTALINTFSNLWKAVQNLIAPLKELWKAFTPNVAHTGKGLALISKWLEKISEMIAKVAKVVGKVLSTVLKPVIFVGNLISKVIMKVFSLIQKVWTKVSGIFSSVGKVIKSFTNTIITAFDKHVTSRIKAFQETLSKTFATIKKRAKESKVLNDLIKAFRELRIIIHDLFGRVVVNATMYAEHFVLYLKKIWNAIAPLISSALVSVLKALANIILPKLRAALTFVADKLREFGDYLSKVDLTKTKFYKALTALPKAIKDIANSKTFKSITKSIKSFGSEALAYLIDMFAELKTRVEAVKMPNGLKDLFSNITNFIKSIFGKDSISNGLTDALEETVGATEDMAGKESSKKLTAFQSFLEAVTTAFNWLSEAADKAIGAIRSFVDFIIKNTPKALKAMHDFIAGDDGIIQMSDITDTIYTISTALSEVYFASGINKLAEVSEGFSANFDDIAESITIFMKRISNSMKFSALKDFAIAIGIVAGAIFLLSLIPDTKKLLAATAAITAVAYAITKFFDIISSAELNLTKSVGFLSLAALVVSIGVAMVGAAASLGVLVGALAIFPKVIKQYNNLGDEFKTGMERVKKVLSEIFEYLDHTVNAKYSLRSALGILSLVAALSFIRKTIVKFASAETGDAMEDGLARIKKVLDLLGNFLASVTIASFSFINVGIDFDTLGMAAVIAALAFMIKKITPSIFVLSNLTPEAYETAFNALSEIFFQLSGFIVVASVFSKVTGTGLGKWMGVTMTLAVLGGTIGSIVESLKAIADLNESNPEGLKKAISTMREIFIELGAVMLVIGKMKQSKAPLFALSLSIGVLTACLIALVPIVDKKPEALRGAVIALGLTMIAFGTTLWLAGKAGETTKTSALIKLLGTVAVMMLVVNSIRNLARTGGSAGSIVAAGVAISLAAVAIAGAMYIIGAASVNPIALVGMLLLTAAIWGIVFAIRAFKGDAGGMSEGAKQVENGVKDIKESASDMGENLSMSLDISGLLDSIMSKIGEKIKSFDLGAAIRNLIEKVKTDAVNWAQDIFEIGTNLIEGLSNTLSNPENIEKLKQAMIDLGKSLLTAFKALFGIHSPSTVMADQGNFIIDGLLIGLKNFPSKLAEWISGIGEFILGGITSLVSGAIEKGKELVSNIGEGIKKGKEFVVEKAHAIGEAAVKAVGKAKEWGSKALENAKTFGANLQASKNPVAKAAGTLITGATKVVSTAGAIFKSSAQAAATKFRAELNAGKGPVRAAASAIVASAKSAFTNIGTTFKNLGIDAANGFKNGLNKMISSIAEKAKEMVNRAKKAAQEAQNSHSPSKDFMKYGGWAAQGYAIGLSNRKSTSFIEANAKKMIDAAKNATSSTSLGFSSLYLDSNPAMSSLAYAISQISDSFDDSVNTSPTIRPVIDMSDVHRNAPAIAALFGDKGIGASVSVMGSAQDDFNRTMSNRANAYSFESIDKLASRINAMTDTMNSRSMNNYITVDGATDPNAFADELLRSFRVNARTV